MHAGRQAGRQAGMPSLVVHACEIQKCLPCNSACLGCQHPPLPDRRGTTGANCRWNSTVATVLPKRARFTKRSRHANTRCSSIKSQEALLLSKGSCSALQLFAFGVTHSAPVALFLRGTVLLTRNLPEFQNSTSLSKVIHPSGS